MPVLVGTRRQLFNSRDQSILLKDIFNGSFISPAKWTLIDTESKLSVSGGNLVCSGGRAAADWTDPAAVSKASWARLAGLTIEWQITPTLANSILLTGFTDGSLAADGNEPHGIYFGATELLYVVIAAATTIVPYARSAAQVLWCRIVCLAAGAYYYVSADNRVSWKLIWVDTTVTTSPLYAFIESYNAAFTASSCRVQRGSAPTPVVNISQTITPSLGGELAAGNLTVGSWYEITATAVDYFFTGCAIGDDFRATAATALDANNKVKLITLSSCLGSLQTGRIQGLFEADITVADGKVAGLWFNTDGLSDGTQDGVEVLVDRAQNVVRTSKYVNGTLTATLSSGALTYSAAAIVRGIRVSNSVRPYYNNATIGSELTVSDASILALNGICGFSTDPNAVIQLRCYGGVNVA